MRGIRIEKVLNFNPENPLLITHNKGQGEKKYTIVQALKGGQTQTGHEKQRSESTQVRRLLITNAGMAGTKKG